MSTAPTVLHADAPAKLNLSLKITGKRQDGYHLLDSIFIPLKNVSDHLSLTLREDGSGNISISSNLPEMTDCKTNLCSKAVRLYCKTAEINPSCHIDLQKNIPIGAGLGGGSSDCAAVLKILNAYYNRLSEKQLHDCALSLGADVPFFLVEKLSRITGIGEKIQPLNCTFNYSILVCKPFFSISTPWAFKHINPSIIGIDSSESTSKIVDALQNDDILTAVKYLRNDFENLLFSKFPAYIVWKNFLLTHGALYVGLSGSGSAFFAVFAEPETMASAGKILKEKYPLLLDIFET